MPDSASPLPAAATPATERELLQNAQRLAGRSLGSVANDLGVAAPRTLKFAKGWIGELVERALGATAHSRPVPDFESLGIELKTIPINDRGQPRESTFVSVVPLANVAGLTWDTSVVKAKLARVLWLPIEAGRGVPVAARRIGQPLLWSPTRDDAEILRADWEEHIERIALGRLDELDARLGTYLQIRPKAYNRAELTMGIDADGAPTTTLPRGFYLRASFTRKVLCGA